MSFSRPYKTIPNSFVDPSWWNDSDGLRVGDYVPHQVGQDMRLNSIINVALSDAIESVFGEEFFERMDLLDIVVESSSTKTRLRTPIFRSGLTDKINRVDLLLPGELIAGKMTIRRLIVLNASLETQRKILPRNEGQILWENIFEFSVEGENPQISMQNCSFAGSGFRKKAWWTFEYSSIDDLDEQSFNEPFAEHFRILFNSDVDAAEKISRAGIAEEDGKPLMQILASELISEILKFCVSDEFDEAREYPKGSLGRQVCQVLNLSSLHGKEAYSLLEPASRIALAQGVAFR